MKEYNLWKDAVGADLKTCSGAGCRFDLDEDGATADFCKESGGSGTLLISGMSATVQTSVWQDDGMGRIICHGTKICTVWQDTR